MSYSPYLLKGHARSRAYRWGEDGLGASQQTGWTALIAKLIQQVNDKP